ncbi:MAG: hypothetical protein ACKVKY_09910, partial [Burkholderiales bacterium]
FILIEPTTSTRPIDSPPIYGPSPVTSHRALVVGEGLIGLRDAQTLRKGSGRKGCNRSSRAILPCLVGTRFCFSKRC